MAAEYVVRRGANAVSQWPSNDVDSRQRRFRTIRHRPVESAGQTVRKCPATESAAAWIGVRPISNPTNPFLGRHLANILIARPSGTNVTKDYRSGDVWERRFGDRVCAESVLGAPRRALSAARKRGHIESSRCRQASPCSIRAFARFARAMEASSSRSLASINRLHDGCRRLPAATNARTSASVKPASWQSRINAIRSALAVL